MPLRKLKGDLKQPGQHVYVFMPVEVRRRETSIADFLNLRVPLILHFRKPEPTPCQPQKQALWSGREFAIVIQKAGDGFPVGHRRAVAQVQMHADTQPGAERAASTPPANAAPLASSEVLVTIP